MPVAAREGVSSTASVLLPHASESAAAARRSLVTDLAARGIARPVIDDATLVLSELVSNALKHARPLPSGTLRVSWDIDADCVRVDVTDGGAATRPQPHPPSMSALGGRGLAIVGNLATDWGISEGGGETTVWALIAPRSALSWPLR